MTRLAPYIHSITVTINQSATALFASNPCPLSADEFLSSVLPSDDLEALRRTAELTGRYDVNNSSVMLALPDDPGAVLIGIYPSKESRRMFIPGNLVLQGERTSEVMAWARECAAYASDFGRLIAFFRWMRDHEISVEAARQLVPTLPGLLRDSGFDELADRIIKSRTSKFPAMPPDVRAAMRRGNELLAAVSMIDKNNTPSVAGKVVISFDDMTAKLDTHVRDVDYGADNEEDEEDEDC